jgi:hypothetical protein
MPHESFCETKKESEFCFEPLRNNKSELLNVYLSIRLFKNFDLACLIHQFHKTARFRVIMFGFAKMTILIAKHGKKQFISRNNGIMRNFFSRETKFYWKPYMYMQTVPMDKCTYTDNRHMETLWADCVSENRTIAILEPVRPFSFW